VEYLSGGAFCHHAVRPISASDLAVISKLLGHSSFSTTANVYAHLTRDTQRRAADRMDAILGAPRTVAAH
jgi:integrase